MRTPRIWVPLIAAGLGVGIALGWRMRASRADGIPLDVPLSYGGVLENNGAPVNGPQNLTINVWQSATSTAASDRVCTTVAANTPVTNGYFRVSLDPTCTSVVQTTPHLWIEVVVAGTTLARTPIAALPFAVEANHAHVASTANAAGGALDTRISAIESATSGISGLQTRVATLEGGFTPGNAAPHGWTLFRKGGNNGTVSCSTFCAGVQWGTVGVCVSGIRLDNNGQIDCSTVTGLISSGDIECLCVAITP